MDNIKYESFINQIFYIISCGQPGHYKGILQIHHRKFVSLSLFSIVLSVLPMFLFHLAFPQWTGESWIELILGIIFLIPFVIIPISFLLLQSLRSRWITIIAYIWIGLLFFSLIFWGIFLAHYSRI